MGNIVVRGPTIAVNSYRNRILSRGSGRRQEGRRGTQECVCHICQSVRLFLRWPSVSSPPSSSGTAGRGLHAGRQVIEIHHGVEQQEVAALGFVAPHGIVDEH